MSHPVISVENLSKSYLIAHQGQQEAYTSLRDTLSKHAKNFTRRTFDTLRGKQMLQGDSIEEFWALNDVSFEVQQGEVLGIIGRNGAGKSTLLKVLSRITEPTKGSVKIRGRVASLLEVGTGFHPELSGRENIFLNGAILGMSRKEIKAKFDEIVDFAGVEKFLDTPVKRYSSGMYVRLAFAVAAHLEPEILVVDEVLAVGDAEFQKKCLGKMKDVAGEGRTVLFVSHAMAAVSSLCSRVIVMESGTKRFDGGTEDGMDFYLRETVDNQRAELIFEKGNNRFWINRIRLESPSGQITRNFKSCEDVKIMIGCEAIAPRTGTMLSLRVTTARGTIVFTAEKAVDAFSNEKLEICYIIPSSFLTPNNYAITFAIHIPNVKFYTLKENIISFQIEETGSMMENYIGTDYGVVMAPLTWETT